MIERTTVTFGDNPRRERGEQIMVDRSLFIRLCESKLAYEIALVRISGGADNPVEIAAKVLMGAKE